jgi:glutamate-5-semialdehyde dehydrogenase
VSTAITASVGVEPGLAPAPLLDIRTAVVSCVEEARRAARELARAPTDLKNRALRGMAKALMEERETILSANARDVARARADGLSAALIDRLALDERRLGEMVASIESVAELPDPVGEVLRTWRRPNGMEIRKVRVPLGVVGIIYESRPNVTSDCAALCLKSGNAVVLRGGSESFRSNQAVAGALRRAVAEHGLPESVITPIPVADRAGVDVMLELDQLIDVIIPRGGEALIRKIVETSRIPVIKHAKGVCHVYVDAAADLQMAGEITLNAKCQRPSTCNALETLLVHEGVARAFLPGMIRDLKEKGVEVRGCETTQALVPGIRAATEEDWLAEYLSLVLAVRVVPSLEEAIEHITHYGSAHSDAIVTADQEAADRFLRDVDSSAVFVNASTRLSDGYQFGLGAEIGISTDRLHARGPMGLEELTTYKYVVLGTGQIRE